MAKVYLSFLGTNDYLACTYYTGGREVNNVRFIQEATLGLYCRNWTSYDRIIVFTTDEANRKNWLDNGHEHPCKGLKNCIKDLNLNAPAESVLIPVGKSENEIWHIFQIVYDSLNRQDEVVFDITHAFRSIPMLAIVILNYAKVMKDVTLEGIYYGAFEVLGSIQEAKKLSVSERKAPILDLTSFDQLMEWSFAVDRFLKAGDAHPVSSLAKKSVKPVLAATKGRDAAASTIRNIADNLEEFTETLSTCRGLDITSTTSKLKQNIDRCQGLKLIQPFKPIFDRIKNQMDLFSGNSIADGIQAAKWCLEHNLIQQGYTILQETLISYFIIKINENSQDYKLREIARQAAKIFAEQLPVEKWKGLARNYPEISRKFLEFYKTKNELLKIFRNLSNYRNDLNHAGNTQNPMNANNFNSNLKSIFEELSNKL